MKIWRIQNVSYPRISDLLKPVLVGREYLDLAGQVLFLLRKRLKKESHG